MPDEVKTQRNSAAYDDGSREYNTQHRNADEKYQHAADGEDCSCDASANRYLRDVNLRA